MAMNSIAQIKHFKVDDLDKVYAEIEPILDFSIGHAF
jgi:hypothetical protein